MMLNVPDALNARILIVDDEDAHVQWLARLLSQTSDVNVTFIMQRTEVAARYRAHRLMPEIAPLQLD